MKSTQNSSTEGRGSSCSWSGEVTKFDGGKPLLHPHCLTTLSLIAFRKQTSHFPLLLWPLLFSTCLQALLLPDTVVASKSYVALLSPLHVPPDHSMLILAPMNWHLYTWHSHLGPQLLTCTYHRPAPWDSSNPTNSKVTHSLFNIFKMDSSSGFAHLFCILNFSVLAKVTSLLPCYPNQSWEPTEWIAWHTLDNSGHQPQDTSTTLFPVDQVVPPHCPWLLDFFSGELYARFLIPE
jgi:hypothetical protein